MRYSNEEIENIREFLQENKDLINVGRFREVFENMLDPDSKLMLLEVFLKSGIRPSDAIFSLSNKDLISIAETLIEEFDNREYREQGLFVSEIMEDLYREPSIKMLEEAARVANWLGYSTYYWNMDGGYFQDILIVNNNLDFNNLLETLNKERMFKLEKDDFDKVKLW